MFFNLTLKENSLSVHRFKLALLVKNLHFQLFQFFLPGEVLASVQGNNEVGLWNMESQFRQLVLWASSSPLLSTNQSNSQSVTAMQSIQNHEMNTLITGNNYSKIFLKSRFFLISNTRNNHKKLLIKHKIANSKP